MGKPAGEKEGRFLGVILQGKKLKKWEYYSIYHLSSECSDSEVAKMERVPGMR